MNEFSIKGHALPSPLVHLLSSGSWVSSVAQADLSSLPIEDQEDLTFLDVAQMRHNTEELQAAWQRGEGKLFGLTEARSESGLLDITQAVVIGATFGQEVLALDFSVGADPRVVATQYQSGSVNWIEVAPNFAQLLKQLKLSES